MTVQPSSTGREELRQDISAAQMAYGLLWREMRVSDKPYVKLARAVLLASLTHQEQGQAIAWVQARYPITESETI